MRILALLLGLVLTACVAPGGAAPIASSSTGSQAGPVADASGQEVAAAPASPGPTPSPTVSPEPGCQPAVAPSESGEYQTYPPPRGAPPQVPILSSGGSVVDDPATATVGGLTILLPRATPAGLRVVLGLSDERPGEPTGLRIYYGTKAIDAKMTVTAFLVGGGIVINEHQPDGRDAQTVIDTIGRRAALVAIGPYPGAFVHGDEIKSGYRPYALYWSDGDREFSVLAGTNDPAALIDLARSIYCH